MPGPVPEPLPDPANDDPFPAECARTHLYAGARCLVRGLPDPAGFAAAPTAVGLALRFSDGVTTAAELLVSDRGDLALAVAAHTTAAGTPTAERLWGVRRTLPAEGGVELVIGRRQDQEPTGPRK
ncbi:hypothetical protein ACIRF8_10625 [Streptomyces sp. NPDC102406]|uniref:hypothetical protein n=1 Tax=Streptomyces sp. NPDC102406 TaxID=3366171 RepID=UPI003817B1A3